MKKFNLNTSIKILLKDIDKHLDRINNMGFDFIEDDNSIKEHETLKQFISKFNRNGLNPIIISNFLIFLQLMNDRELLEQYDLVDIKNTFIKLNRQTLRQFEYLEDCLYFLRVMDTKEIEIEIEEQKNMIKDSIKKLLQKLSVFEKEGNDL